MSEQKLTPEQIAAIRARLEAAENPPWRVITETQASREFDYDAAIVYGVDDAWICNTGCIDFGHVLENADFIASAPTDIAALLAHAAALEAENAALSKVAEDGRKLAQTWRTVAVSKEETEAMYFRSGDMYSDALKRSTEADMLSACAKSLDELLDAANE